LLLAVPLRHLMSAAGATAGPVILPAGGPGDLDAASAGMPLIVMATDAGDAEVPAATWRATFVRRVPYDVGAPWPDGVPPTWSEEHPVPPAAPPSRRTDVDEDDEDDDDDEDDVGPQSFLEVSDLRPLPRDSWLFANELVGKQSRRGRSFRPHVPTIVDLPD
jgi:hypothetical protein